jgi:hypothetical protein
MDERDPRAVFRGDDTTIGAIGGNVSAVDDEEECGHLVAGSVMVMAERTGIEKREVRSGA